MGLANWIRNTYLKHKYEDKLPEISYDNVFYVYTHPNVDYYCFYIESVAEELCDDCLCYEFKIGGEYKHHHELHNVIKDAYNYGSQFTIPFECESDYSEQELRLLRKLADKGEMDRMEYRKEHRLNDITMTTEDPCESII